MTDPEPTPAPPAPEPSRETPRPSGAASESPGPAGPTPSAPAQPAGDAPDAGAATQADTAAEAEETPTRPAAKQDADGETPSLSDEPRQNATGEQAGEKKLDLSRSRLAREPGAAEEPEEEGGAEPAAEELLALRRTVEALLFAADEPLTARELARAAGIKTLALRKALKLIREAYETEQRPWELVEVAGGYRLMTRAEFFPAVQKLKAQRAQRKLTQAALETLALVAYSKEPIGRAEIEAVRGVDSGPVLRLLLERKLVRIAGRGPGLGQPLLYAVSQDFLTHFGLSSTQDLPRPGEFKAP